MEAVKAHDRKRLIRTFLTGDFLIPIGLFAVYVGLRGPLLESVEFTAVVGLAILSVFSLRALKRFQETQFANRSYQILWDSVRDRKKRFDESLRELGASKRQALELLPRDVQNVYDSVHAALRRADMVQSEINSSEGFMNGHGTRATSHAPATDDFAKELYLLADQNIAEYHRRMRGISGGLQRCQAQTQVFITTLDSLRLHVLAMKLASRSPEIEHGEFMDAIKGAKERLASVDTALSEIDYSRLAAIAELDNLIPPPLPNDAKIQERP